MKSIRSASNLAKPVSRSSSKTSNAWVNQAQHGTTRLEGGASTHNSMLIAAMDCRSLNSIGAATGTAGPSTAQT